MCDRCDRSECRHLIEAFIDLYPEAEHREAHIVLSDYNLETHHIQRCLESLDGIQGETALATTRFLELLIAIPETTRIPS